LESCSGNRDLRERRWEFLAERPRSHRENGYLYVHGSARNPLNEYVFPEDVYNQRKMERIFALVEKYCFQGHTHVPGIFTEQVPDDIYQFLSPEEVEYNYQRDGDWRACYILLDGDVVRYQRVEYDVETTIKKIYEIPELENFLGDRLRDGR
jgi:diadenosine tetraphosphatase ApaH/serine/threonine PP2A family protein phosphatase